MGQNNKNKKLTPEEVKKIKKKNNRLVQKIKDWQEFPYVKPLICKKCKEAKLEPKPTRFKVILKCPHCKNIQYYIPKPILQTRLARPAVLLRNQSRYNAIPGTFTEDDSDD